MEVPMRPGQQAQWPLSVLPIETLEGAAQDWYAFRDRSMAVKLFNNQWVIIVLAMLPVLFMSPLRGLMSTACKSKANDSVWCDWASYFAEPGLLFGHGFILIMFIPLILGSTLYVKCKLLPQLKDEAQSRLAEPLSQLLARAGWSVQAYHLLRDRGTRAPKGLEQGCCTPGWIWLEFFPSQPEVGAAGSAPAVHTAQPVFDAITTGTVVRNEDPSIARAREIQPVMAYGSAPGTYYRQTE